MKTFVKALLARLSVLALAALGVVALPASAQPALYVDGVHYNTINEPVRTADPNKIEVTELFWYGCQHCYAFEPLLESWVEKLPSDVAFVRSPGMWNDMMKTHAQIFYTTMELGVFDKLHSVTFNAIHQQRNYLETEAAIKALFEAQGVAAADFDRAWKSFTVSSAVRQADTRFRAYGARGVPNLVVNGKYLVSAGDSVSQTDMLRIADFLIQKERGS
jgi:protein dithiol oxidoreductase (disulfide-forming)